MPQASVLNEAKWEAIDEKMILSSHANKTHFNKNGFVPNLVLKEKLSGAARKWPNSSGTSKQIHNHIMAPRVIVF